jgi:small subunit ribosomal protein S5
MAEEKKEEAQEEKKEESTEEKKDEKESAKVIKPGKTPTVTDDEERREIMGWKPKTKLGRDVMAGKIENIDEILKAGKRILEPEIVDMLVPDIKSELILVGGRSGKGGGIQRIPVKITATMHRSGRRFKMNSFVAVGDENGLIGISKASALESRAAIQKAIRKAKMNVIRIKRGCGSWECGCDGEHSIPYKTEGKSGSVRVVLMPAPKGLGLAADNETKKILKLAGIKDIWVKTYGNTKMRLNLIQAVFNALKNLYVYDR